MTRLFYASIAFPAFLVFRFSWVTVRIARRSLIALAVVLGFVASGAVSAREPSVAFVNPGAEAAADVWGAIPRFMGAAAEQFGIRLEVLYANRDRLRMVELARELASRATPPDYVVLVNEKQRAPEMMEFFRGTRTRILLLHNDLTLEQRRVTGDERGNLPNWIGTITTDDNAIVQATVAGLYRKSSVEPRIAGVGGDEATPVSAERETAVRAFVNRAGRGRMLQVAPGNWTRADAADKAQGLLRRYPEINMMWAANDTMALGVLDAVTEMKRRDKVLVGGVGAFPDALDSVAEGGLAITAGGHTLIGAWCMVMIHDYDRGRDFAATGGPRKINNTVVVVDDAAAAARFRSLSERPSSIDFRRFSLAENHRLKDYDFGYDALQAAQR